MQFRYSWGLLLVFSLPLSQATHGPDECRWSPLQQKREPTCGVKLGPTQLGVEHDGWVGPHHCVGQHCLFSNSLFRGGIALASTARNVKIVRTMVDEYQAQDESGSTEKSFYEANIPGKGIGLVANRAIRRGEHIMTHTPSLIVQLLLHNTMPDGIRDELYEQALQGLPTPKRRSFMTLVGATINDILDKNCFRMWVDGSNEEGTHLGCFEEVARFNHDCRPK